MNLRRSRRFWLATSSLLALSAIAALVWWWFNTHTRIERTIELPPQGEAAHNPLYLLRQSLRADQVDAHSRRYLQLDQFPLGPEDTVLIYGEPQQLTSSETGRLLGWVRRGGHLVLRLPARSSSHPGQSGALLERLGIRILADATRLCHEIKMPGDLPEISYCTNTHFMLDGIPPGAALAAPDNRLAFARLRFGHGTVDVFSHLAFLQNTLFQDPERAVLARQLLAPNYGNGSVHLIYGAQMPPLWRLVLTYGRMAWLPLLLVLAAWLWLRIPRFGPQRPAPLPVRRALLEHIQASGEHLYRHHRADLLLAALRNAFSHRLHRHDPLTAAQHGPARIAAIAARTGLAEAEVADALEAELQDMSPPRFRQRAQALVRMRLAYSH